MKRLRLALPFVLALLSVAACAQTTHTFSFGPLNYNYNSASFTVLDGQTANCGIGYCGSIEVRGGEEPYWGMTCPQSWGFPNNCYLTNNAVTPDQGPITFTQPGCNLATNGCVDYTQTAIALEGYGSGVTLNVTAFYQVHKHIGRFGHVYYSNDSTGGNGTATY